MNIKNEKIKNMKKVELYEKIILFLEKWQPGDTIPDFIKNESGGFETEKQRNNLINLYKYSIEGIQNKTLDDYKLYLSEIIEKEKIEFKSNNLILAPVGSGKTTFLKKLIKEKGCKSLMIVSNTALKDSISPNDEIQKKEMNNRTYTTQNKSIYGEGEHEVYVMTYAEFGSRVITNNDFIEDFNLIICDEIHSLPDYQQFSNSVELSHAIKVLFGKYDDKQIFYLTATDKNLKNLEKRQPGIFQYVTTFEFRDRDDIKKYIALTKYKIKNLDQIRPHLQARLNGFNYFGYKVLSFSKRIEEQKKMEAIASEEGYKPLVLWSINNDKYPMTKEQLKAREYLLKYGIIPEPYNFLIINASMQEGWNLKDKLVKLAIMNTTNETEQTQALGRLRKDVEVLIYRVKPGEDNDVYIDLPVKYYNTPLTTEMKNELCNILDLYSKSGKKMKWTSIKKLLIEQNYKIKDYHIKIDGKQTRVSKIYAEV